MLSPIGLVAIFTVLWLAFVAFLYRFEQQALGPRPLLRSATSSAAILVQVAVLGLGGLWFAATTPPALDLAPDWGFTVVICAALGKWVADFIEMGAYSRQLRAYDVLHHVVSATLLVYALWAQTGAWFLAMAVFLSELPGMTLFTVRTLRRAGLAPPAVVLGLRSLHAVLAAALWLLVIPVFTLWFLRVCDFAAPMVAMCVGYNTFTLWSAHKLLTQTPRTLRKMAAELGGCPGPSLRGEA